MAKVGYARVSTTDQNPSLQIDALNAAGCEKVFTEHASGVKGDRPKLLEALDYLRRGDTLVVWKLDRLGRSTKHLFDTLTGLNEKGIEFASLTEGIDTSTPMGRMLFGIIAVIAQFERELIKERVAAGLIAARAAGKVGGRPRALTSSKEQAARNLRAAGTSVVEIAKILRVGTSTVYRCLEESS